MFFFLRLFVHCHFERIWWTFMMHEALQKSWLFCGVLPCFAQELNTGDRPEGKSIQRSVRAAQSGGRSALKVVRIGSKASAFPLGSRGQWSTLSDDDKFVRLNAKMNLNDLKWLRNVDTWRVDLDIQQVLAGNSSARPIGSARSDSQGLKSEDLVDSERTRSICITQQL